MNTTASANSLRAKSILTPVDNCPVSPLREISLQLNLLEDLLSRLNEDSLAIGNVISPILGAEPPKTTSDVKPEACQSTLGNRLQICNQKLALICSELHVLTERVQL